MGILKMEAHTEGGLFSWYSSLSPSPKNAPSGTGLTPHRAPGNAILTALDGKATIGYEGHDYELTAGQSFRFEKNGLHSVTANAKFKMSLLLVLE